MLAYETFAMTAVLFIATVYVGRRYPDSHPLPVMLFLPLAIVAMVAEGLQ